MSFISVYKFNETYIKIDCEPHVARELGEYFTINVPNAGYHRIGNYKNWNGKLKLFKQREKILPKGLIPYVEKFAEEHKYIVKYEDISLSHCNNISVFEIEKYIKSLDVPFVAYKHQIDAVTHMIRNKRLLLVSPTASGKSFIIYIWLRLLLSLAIKVNKKLLVIVPTTNLVEQMYTDFQDYSTQNRWNVEKNCQRIYSGYEKYDNKPIVISTWQSLATLPPDYFLDFFGLIGDEAHTCTAKTLQAIIGSCTNAIYRTGTTGTIQDTKSHRLTLEGLFGLIYRPTTTHQLIQEKKLAAFQIKCILLKHLNPDQTLSQDYRAELEYLISNQSRNKFIRNLAMSLDNNTLILYDFVEKHGMIIKDLLDKVNKEGRKKIYLIFGGTPVEEVQRIRAEMETRDDIILLASYRKFQLGANVKNLHNIIFASPSKSRIRVCQSIGRELRLHSSKETAFLFDIADDLVYDNKRLNTTLKHFAERIKLYNAEKFPYKLYKVQMK